MYDGIRVNSQGTVSFRDLSGQPIHSEGFFEKHKTFEEKATEELKSLESDNKRDFYIIYRADCCTYCAQTPDEILKISLTPQDYICSSMVKRMIQASHCGVFTKKGSKTKCLWKSSRFNDNSKRNTFLSPGLLEKELKKIFNQVELTLGELNTCPLKVIAWEVKTEKGIFYVFWHNGLMTEKGKDWEFTPKEFKDLRQTYKVLRFAKTIDGKDYKITCG